MSTTERIYRVTIGSTDRLIRASHPSQALTFVAKDIAKVAVASQQDLIDCLTDGVQVEDVKAD